MNGQWLGRYAGVNPGTAIINIDNMGDHYEGIAYLHPDNKALPRSCAYFRTIDKSESF